MQGFSGFHGTGTLGASLRPGVVSLIARPTRNIVPAYARRDWQPRRSAGIGYNPVQDANYASQMEESDGSEGNLPAPTTTSLPAPSAPSPMWKNPVVLVGSVLLLGGLGYLIYRKSKRSKHA